MPLSSRTASRICSLFILFLLFPFNNPALAGERKTVESNEVRIQYDESLRPVAEEIMKVYSQVREELEKTFSIRVEFRPTIVLIKRRQDFLKMTGSNRAVAVAAAQRNLIVIDNSKMKTQPFTLEITLKHELCHLLLYHYAGERRIPRWLNEGISQWVTGGISEIMGVENRDLLKQATLSGRFIPFENLTDRFPGDEKSLHLAYQESRSFVEYIVRESGFEGVLKILAKLREGDDIEKAIGDSLSIPMYALEKNWRAHLKTKYTWFIYVSSHIFQILFSFAALFLTYGFIKFLIRKKNYVDDEDELDEQ